MNVIILTLEFDPSTGNFHTDLLDSLSLSHTILGFEPHFFEQNGRFFWTLCVNCQARISPVVHFQEQEKGKSTSKDSPCLKELKTWRNQRAKKLGFPPYIIASNSLLQDIVSQHPQSLSGLLDIRGFGKKKAQHYGQEILAILKKYPTHEKK